MRIAYVIVPLLLIAACQRDDDSVADAVAPLPPTDATPAPTPAAPVGDAPDVVTRYACDADTTVAILRDGSARVSLPEGRDIDLSRIAGSQPPIYTGSSLYFTIGDDLAHLSQGDETNELVCNPL